MGLLSFKREPTREEPFERLHPKDNFYQSVSFFPMPFAMITTVNEEGLTSIGPHSLAFPFDLIEEPSMMLVSRAGSNTSTNLRRTGKAALNFIKFHKPWLKHVVALGYPGQEPKEKMRDTPFDLIPSPTAELASDPDFPLLMKDAFQVYECEVEGQFKYEPHRETDAIAAENFWRLKVKNVLLKASYRIILEEQKEFPSMAISYGFRHRDNERRFFFCSHNKPFPVHLPVTKTLAHQSIYYDANKMDPEVRFTEEACKRLVDIPKPFLKIALKGLIKEAKAAGVTMIDGEFADKVNAKRNG